MIDILPSSNDTYVSIFQLSGQTRNIARAQCTLVPPGSHGRNATVETNPLGGCRNNETNGRGRWGEVGRGRTGTRQLKIENFETYFLFCRIIIYLPGALSLSGVLGCPEINHFGLFIGIRGVSHVFQREKQHGDLHFFLPCVIT